MSPNFERAVLDLSHGRQPVTLDIAPTIIPDYSFPKRNGNGHGRDFGRALAMSMPQHNRQTIQTQFGRMFRAAQTDRNTSDWMVTLTSADAELLISQIAMRSRMRQLERDNATFRRVLRLRQNNVIGHEGIKLVMKISDRQKQDNGTSIRKLDTETNEIILDGWKDHLRPENCTVRRNISGVKLQRLSERCRYRDGAILLRKHYGPRWPHGFALEPIEIDRLDHWWNRPSEGTANQIKFGIERDEFGAPVAYWILTRHPGDVFAFSASPRYRERVPASDIIAIWDLERAEQSVGFSELCGTATPLHHMEEYILSENIAARIAADQGGWFEQDSETPNDDGMVAPKDAAGNKIDDREPGTWAELPQGWKAKQLDPKHPTQAFPDFIKTNQRLAAAGANMNYNDVASDLESVSYSALKAGRLESIAEYQWGQTMIMEDLMTPWIEAWLPFAILTGKVKLPNSPDKMRRYFSGVTWQGRTWKSVEPLKEITATIAAINAGLDSRSSAIVESGREREDIDAEQMADKASADSHGLEFGMLTAAAKIEKETPEETDPPPTTKNKPAKK